MALPNVIGEAAVRVRPDTTLFRAETQKGVQGALTGLGGLGTLGSTLRFTGITAGIALVTLGAKEAVVGAADLEQSLNVLEVTAGATAAEMAEIGEQARELGADLKLPGISATDATTAMLELSKGGLDVQDTLGGARGVLQLASAAAIEVGEAAAIAAQALSTFRLPGEEATRVADLLTGAAQSATGEVGDMALALSQAGAVAANANISIEDTVTAISLLAKNGLLGSDAGTSLRTTILRLVPATQEAAELMKALGIETSDAAGNLLPLADIFDQYREKLALLSSVQQQEVLTKIFGTDAIRAAAIFAREGAAGFDAMKGSVTEVGIAAEVTAARSEGLKGAVAGLQSNAETLGTSLGSVVIPALTDFVGGINDVVSAANDGITAISDLADAFADLEVDIKPFVGGDFTLGEALDKLAETTFRGTAFGSIKSGIDFLTGSLEEGEEAVDSFIDHAQSELADRGVIKFDIPDSFERAEDNAHTAGRNIAKAIAAGVQSAEELAVDAARDMLAEVVEEGNRAVAEAVRQGNEAVRLSAIDARQNLISIGQELAGQAVALIDQGPLAQRIAELRASLGDTSQGNQRARLRDALRDAQRELEDAEASIATGPGPRTRQEQQDVDRFLDPFTDKVRDAKAALAEFNTEGVIGELEKQAEEQKETVQRGLADLIVQFNQGLLDVQQFNVRSARLLETNGVPLYGAAGKALGIALRENIVAQLKGLQQQAAEIARGLSVPQSGLEPNIVSPGGERTRQNANIAETARSAEENRQRALENVRRAQLNLADSTDKNTDSTDILIEAIRANTAALGGTGSRRGSETRRPVPVSGR